MEKVRFCEACGKALILDKGHHKVVRDDVETGLCTIARNDEPIQYDAFDCEYCGCQTIIGERKREVYEAKFEEVEEDIKGEPKPRDEQISSQEDNKDLEPDCEESINKDDLKDIQKKIKEAGEDDK